jgi:GNAT superfamily N-acetyltransferase
LRRPRRIGEFHESVLVGARRGFLRPGRGNVAAGKAILLAAFLDGRLVGTVQVQFVLKPNQLHRAEIAKMPVHRAARRRGIGTALMRAKTARADRALNLGRARAVLRESGRKTQSAGRFPLAHKSTQVLGKCRA